MRFRYLVTTLTLVIIVALISIESGFHTHASGYRDLGTLAPTDISTDIMDATLAATMAETTVATTAANPPKFTYQTKIEKNGLPHFVDFNAVWCDPCNRMRPYIAHLKVKYAGKITFDSFDVDHDESYDVMARYYPIGTIIPYMLLLDKNLKIVKKLDAYMTEQQLDDEFTKLLAKLAQ